MWLVKDYPITVAETRAFEKAISDVLTRDELEQFVLHIAFNPDEGVVIPGTGGIRKIRWCAKNKGKSKAARIIYYFRDLNMPLYLPAVYTKG